MAAKVTPGCSLLSLDVLDAKVVGPARQEFNELRLGVPDNLVRRPIIAAVTAFTLATTGILRAHLGGPAPAQ